MVSRISFTATLLEGAHVLRSVWPCLPRRGEEDAWESSEAMARYVAQCDGSQGVACPSIPPGHEGPHAAITVALGDRVVTARPRSDAPWIYEWDVDMTARPSTRSAGLLLHFLVDGDFPFRVECE